MPKNRRRPKSRQWLSGLLLISPSLILVGIFVYGLIGANIYTSLTDNHSAAQLSGSQPTNFVGLDNFFSLFSNPDFQHSLKNLVLFTVTFLVGTMVLGFIWAWLMERPLKGEGIFRSIFLFPMAVSFIASGVVWRWLLNPGVDETATGLNRLFQMVGLDFLQNTWTASQDWAILAIAIAAIWQLAGYVMALFLAGFRGISEDLREAAKVDGATAWQSYRHIIFPQLAPVALSAVIIIAHMSLKSFDLIISITNQTWYPTKVPAIDMYNYMTVNDYALAAAVGTILLVIVAIFVVPYLIHDSKENRR